MGTGLTGSGRCPVQEADGTTLQELASVALALSRELGLGHFSRLLDAIADNENFHELTMIN